MDFALLAKDNALQLSRLDWHLSALCRVGRARGVRNVIQDNYGFAQ